MSHINSPIAMALAAVIGDKQEFLRGARYSRTENFFRLVIIIMPRGPRSQYGAAAIHVMKV